MGLFLLLAAALGAGAAAAVERKVLLLRHCPRAPYPDDRHPPLPPNNYTNANNFSGRPFPSAADWGTSSGQCTQKGLELARSIGTALPSILGVQHARFVVDKVTRCEVTAAALGLNSTPIKVDQLLFDPLSARFPGCSQPDWQGTVEAQVKHLQSKIQSARSQLPKLQALLGSGVAPPLDQIADTISNGYLVGGLRVASELIVETFELERTSSMPVAWGDLTDAGLIELSKLRVVYFLAMYGGRDIAQRYASGILAALLYPQSTGATVFVGHDTNLQGVQSLLGLEWQCGPWSANSLPPLSGLLFSHEGGSVRVQAVCPSLESAAPLAMGVASFAGGRSELPEAEFSSLVLPAVEWQCVNSTRAAEVIFM